MNIGPGAHELGLWRGTKARFQPRDRRGRFVHVDHPPQRRLILATAAKMRAQLGLPPDPRLTACGGGTGNISG